MKNIDAAVLFRAETTFAVSKLQPGHSYNFTVKTVSHEDTESVSAVQETFGTSKKLFIVLLFNTNT